RSWRSRSGVGDEDATAHSSVVPARAGTRIPETCVCGTMGSRNGVPATQASWGAPHGDDHASLGGPMSVDAGSKPNTFSIDGREVDIRADETISRAARRLGVKLPHLCYLPKPGYRPDGNCRVCMVEIEGERVLAASCIRTPTPGMKVKTQTDRAKTAR